MREQIVSEEDVKLKQLMPTLESLGYKRDCMAFEQTIEVTEGTRRRPIYADVVIYTSKKMDTPLVVVDTKGPSEPLTRADREQVISYARLLPKIAPLAVLTNGRTTQVFQTIDKSRIEVLPERERLTKDLVGVVLGASIRDALRREATRALFTIDDVGVFRALLRKCHEEIRNNEGYDPVQAFDELSKVLFAKMYEEKTRASSNRFTLETFDDTLKRLGVNIVQQQFKEIILSPEYAELFTLGDSIKLRDRTIRAIVSTFERFDLTLTAFDVKGEAFEYFLGDTFTGGLGEYFTPRNVVEFMVDAISPKIGDKIIDPFCGTGGFLIYAFDVVSKKIRLQEFSDEERDAWQLRLSTESLFGTDWKERTVQACKMNMVVHGDGHAGIFLRSGFDDVSGEIQDGTFSICLTNPPFGAIETDPKVLQRFELGKGRKSQQREILALERCIRLVRPGGVVAIVMIDGVLNNESMAYVREYVRRHTNVLAVVSLPKDTFAGYGSRAKTSILFLRRKHVPSDPASDRIFAGICMNTGYGPTGAEVAGNELPDILFDYRTAYPKGDEEKFVHPLSFVGLLADSSARLDAEFYAKSDSALLVAVSPAALSEQVARDVAGVTGVADALRESLPYLGADIKYEKVRIAELLAPVEDKFTLFPGERYAWLGVRWWGDGVFLREEKLGRETKAKVAYRVRSGQLIYNRLFAWKGSFARVPPELAYGVVSGEFPTFEPTNNKWAELIVEYLAFYLVSPSVLTVVERISTGSTKVSRNRLREEMFLNLPVPVPEDPGNMRAIIAATRKLRELQIGVKALERTLKGEKGSIPLALKALLPPME